MKDETAAWLEPMLLRATPEMTDDAFARSQFPLAESLEPAPFAEYLPADARSFAVDWVRFGQLLRQGLSWYDYPEEPGEG